MKLVYIILSFSLVLLMACQPLDVAVEDNATTNVSDVSEPIFSDVSQNMSGDETIIDATPADVPTRTVDAGDVVQLSTNFAVDPDGGELTYLFPSPFNQTGAWQTTHDDVGEHMFTVRVTDGTFISSMDFRVVVRAVNRPPVIEGFNDVVVNEGDFINITPTIYDPDNDTLDIRYSGFMTSPTYQTTFSDAGNYTVILTVSDGVATVQEEIQVTILPTNRPPVLQNVQDITVTEGDFVTVTPFAYDPDGDNVTLFYTEPFNQNGTFQSAPGDVGTYVVNVTASDGDLSVTESFTLTVLQQNRPPVIDAPDTVTAKEGEVFTLDVSVSDPDGDPVSVSYSGFMQSSSRFIDFGEAGEHVVTVTASDGKASTTKDITIVVEKVKRPPVFVGDLFA